MGIMRIVIAGGSGLLGRALTARLQHDGDTVVVLTRHPKRAFDLAWNPNAPAAPWAEAVASADAVINLAGESIGERRWTKARKAALFDSRVRSTRALARAIQEAGQKPLAFLSGSAIGIYGPRGDEPVTEETPPGSDFLSRLAVEWEREALTAARATRVVLLRTSLVFTRDGGALPQMALPFRFFAGGPIGSGRQGVSWIHIDDWVSLVRWVLDRSSVAGPLNVTAPEPVSNAEFARTLGRVLDRPAFMRVPGFAVRLALGEMADAIVNGQHVVPAKALSLGFRFRYPRLEEALREIYDKWKSGKVEEVEK
jgi:uncharacterized protein (TIGR01777 family)